MSLNHFTVDILTPAKIVAKDVPAESLLVPTVKGQMNILNNHTHVIAKLETGHVSVFGGEDDPERYYTVTTGMCKVLDDKVTILSNTSEEDREIDVERAQQALDRAQEILRTETLNDDELDKYRRKVERAKLRLQLASFRG